MTQPVLFGADPIDLLDPAPYGPLTYYGHLVIGTLAIGAALVALYARKGGTNHRLAGYVFLGTTLLVCLTSISMLARVFIGPLFMAVFTAIYALGGAWLALQKGSRTVRTAEIALTIFEIVGLILFMRIALGAVAEGIIPPIAPWVIAAIPLILIAGDVHWFAKPQQRNRLRLARHINRTVWGFVVVIRAPLVEIAAAGVPIPAPVTVVGPIILGVVMLVYFRRKYVRRARTSEA